MTAEAFERELAQHCSPAMAGIKPANIVTFLSEVGEERNSLYHLIHIYSRRFWSQDLRFQILCECPRRILLMVYRSSLLEAQVNQPSVKRLLEKEGYRLGRISEMVEQVGERIKQAGQCQFPHEIGVFLGYPLEDVKGFIENKGKNFLYSGYWKVYSDVERAKSYCRHWEQVRDRLLQVMDTGKTIYDMFYLHQKSA